MRHLSQYFHSIDPVSSEDAKLGQARDTGLAPRYYPGSDQQSQTVAVLVRGKCGNPWPIPFHVVVASVPTRCSFDLGSFGSRDS
jgi:hypothetical protein